MKKRLIEKPKIALLTDTEALNALILSSVDEKFYEFKVYNSSNEKLFNNLIEFKPNCLFLKTTLHTGNGLEICSKIRSKPEFEKLLIFFLSTDINAAEQAIEYRANRFLHIPFTSDDVRLVIDEFLPVPKTVLYVEDSKMLHEKVVPKLKEAGFHVFECFNGREGYEAVQNYEFDIIVSDVEMPEMTGLELCMAIKQNSSLRSIPFILTTTLDTDDAIDQGFSSGANDYMTKPFLEDELIERIKLYTDKTSNKRAEQVLIVHGNDFESGIIQQALKLNGLSSEIVRNGRTALAKLRKMTYNVVILGKSLLFINNYDFLYLLRHDTNLKSIPVLVLTDGVSKSTIIKFKSLGINDYIQIPFSNDSLLAKSERILSIEREKRKKTLLRRYLTDEAIEAVYSETEQFNPKMGAKDEFRTVLFTDIEKFTPLCENLKSHEVIDFLNSYFDVMVEILHNCDGMIDKFIGDAIMALFSAQADGAHRAVFAAVKMIEALPVIRLSTGIDIHMRIGINSGHVILGDIGSRLYRRDYTVIGDNVNIAQRLESNAERDSVLISETTYELIKQKVSVEKRELTLKGKASKVNAYKVIKVDPY
jgi:DNA-binding response OmpR family regulator/class 3 adenylate cyclase